jgi:hypothetical protein
MASQHKNQSKEHIVTSANSSPLQRLSSRMALRTAETGRKNQKNWQ